jgi:UDP-N-acetylglucosamine--N-acetylmuramyl-(pentapeptide) pyrophosphoryl-undecaprenol N-acetylglucosamine transferase
MDERMFAGGLVFTGGGTGGHYFPAVALAEAAGLRWPDRPIAFVGARRGIEARLLPMSPWPHLLLEVEGIVGRSPWRALQALLKLARARARLKAVWKRQRPWAVIGTGGYGAAPALLAARALGIPYFLHESNAKPGLLVQHLAEGSQGVWCGMEAARGHLHRIRALTVGTPVRAAFLREFQPLAALTGPRRLLVLGGSGGARSLNQAVLAMAPALLESFPGWELLHQTGAADYPALAALPRHPRHALAPFLDGMDQVLEASSLVLTRAGASTCAELIACGRPALMVPMPASAGDHQRINAQAMVAGGRALMVEQGEGFPVRLEAAAAGLLADPAQLAALARPEPNRAVTLCLEDLAGRLGG